MNEIGKHFYIPPEVLIKEPSINSGSTSFVIEGHHNEPLMSEEINSLKNQFAVNMEDVAPDLKSYGLAQHYADSLLLFTDIQVKHAKMLDEKSIEQSANEALTYGADALIITGDWTGQSPSLYDCETAKKIAKATPVLIGSGLDKDNVKALFKYADGAIVGTSTKTGDYIDFKKVIQLVEIVKMIRNN